MAINFGDFRDGIEMEAIKRLDATDDIRSSVLYMLTDIFDLVETCGGDAEIARVAAVQALVAAAANIATEEINEDGLARVPHGQFCRMADGLWKAMLDEKDDTEH